MQLSSLGVRPTCSLTLQVEIPISEVLQPEVSLNLVKKRLLNESKPTIALILAVVISD